MGRRLHGAIAPTTKNLWVMGAMPPSRPTRILLCHFSNSKMSQLLPGDWLNPYRGCTQPKCTVKITNITSCKTQKVRLFQPENAQKAFGGRILDLLWELTAFHMQTP